MQACLIYDGNGLEGIFPVLWPDAGDPFPDQLDGTPLENLTESASRICYDSFGVDLKTGKRRGRPAATLHQHILDVINLSVQEHSNFTIRFTQLSTDEMMKLALACLNRKGMFVTLNDGLEITTNFRAILEWSRYVYSINDSEWGTRLWRVLYAYGKRLAPRVFVEHDPEAAAGSRFKFLMERSVHKTEDLDENQAWITLWLYGSRGFTHEQVRHRFAMSQRSTRYVDEDGSPYIEHPLVTKFLNAESVQEGTRMAVREMIDRSMAADRTTYRELVARLEQFGLSQGLDKQTARKQARGAARGYLGNALASEMLFSAPVSGWKWILQQRASKFADAEIRKVYTPALRALKSSRFGYMFEEFVTVPAPDGMGEVLQ